MTDNRSAPPTLDSTRPPSSLSSYLIMVVVGAFATTFGQQKVIGNYPILFLLKDQMGFGPEKVSEFFLWATFAWNLKPLAGVLTDAFPIFGSRRRLYMLFGALGAGLSWLALGFCTDNYPLFLFFSILLNIAIVFGSTCMGGLQVEAGQIYGIPGRVSSLRQIVSSVCQVAAPLMGGWLAGQAFGYTAGIGAFVLLLMAAYTFFGFKEVVTPPPPALTAADLQRPPWRPNAPIIGGIAAIGGAALFSLLTPGLASIGYSLFALLTVFFLILGLAMSRLTNPVLFKAQGQLSQILESRTLWLAVGMLFLVYTVPGLYTPLTFRQSDELKFSEDFIGALTSAEAAIGLLFAMVYAGICSRFTLRTLLVAGIGANAVITLLYLWYDMETANAVHALLPLLSEPHEWFFVVHGLGGALVVISELALMDLAVRSTPRGCEALGFSLMMSIRNFGISMSDVIGSKLLETYHVSFTNLVIINVGTTLAILFFVPLLPKALVLKKEGEQMG